MLQLTVLAEADRDGMLLRSRAKRAAAVYGERVGVDFVVVGEGRGGRTSVSGVSRLPALLVNADVAVQGRVPSSEEIASIVRDALARGYRDLTVREEDGYLVVGAGAPSRVPTCDGCARACSLGSPGCGNGRRRAKEMGIDRR